MQETNAETLTSKDLERAADHHRAELRSATPRPLLKFADFCEFAETIDRLPKPEPE